MTEAARELINRFAKGAEQLKQAISGMTREQLRARPIPGKWSTLEVVCHLCDSDQAWVHRMKRVIAEEKPLLIGYDETRFTASLDYHGRELEPELELIDRMRRQMCAILEKLTPSQWQRVGIHNERGLVTLTEMVEIESDHFPHHIEHIQAKRKALGI